MRTGVLEAEGDITAKFLEDCNIFSRNNIQAEYIINLGGVLRPRFDINW